MKFHGVTMTGKLIIQKVNTLPVWEVSDEGRLIFDQTEQALYIGTDSEWKEAGAGGGYGFPVTNFTDNSTLESGKMYFIDTSSQSLTGNLQSSPSIGDTVTIVDVAGSFKDYSFTINGNGNTIHTDSSLEVDVNDVVLSAWILQQNVTSGSGIGSGGVGTILFVDGNTDANVNEFLFVDTSSGQVTITLPASGDLYSQSVISIFDQKGTFENHSVIVNPTQSTIGNDSFFEGNISNLRADFIYDAEENDWKIDLGGALLTGAAGSGGGSAGVGLITSVDSNTIANNNDFLFVDTTSGQITITLPPSGQLTRQSVVSIYDETGQFSTNSVMVNPQNSTINGDLSFEADINNIRCDFIYNMDENDWKVDLGGSLMGTVSSSINPASETVAGITRYSTNTEAITGTNDSTAITPETLKAVLQHHGLI